MRIAMLGHKRIPSREGGVEVVVEELSVRMAKMGNFVTCFNRSGHHVSGKEFDAALINKYNGVQIKIVPALRAKGLAAMTASFFASLRAAFGRYDVVHFHTEGPCAMLWLTKLMGKRCIATVHGLDHMRSKWGGLAKAYIMLGEKCAAKFADEIIVLSKNVQDYFWQKYNRQTWYIPNGIKPIPPRKPAVLREKYGLDQRDYVLYLGRITPEKGIHYLMDAYRQLKTDKKLVIAGGISDSEDYFESLKAMAAGDKNILFTGFVQGDILAELYSNAYIYVLPSDLEGMPLSLLEAMSCGNCCLVSDIAECADVIGENGVTFRRGDVQDLADKLSLLLGNEALVENYREATLANVGSKLTWDDVTARTLAVYRGEKP